MAHWLSVDKYMNGNFYVLLISQTFLVMMATVAFTVPNPVLFLFPIPFYF